MSQRVPLVSVVIPAYNSVAFLAEALSSVKAQNWTDYEIVVIDDGSTDGTAEVARRFEETRVISQRNAGQANARNRGVAEARGSLIAFLDADDIWHPDMLRCQVEAMNADGTVSLVYTNGWTYDGSSIVPVNRGARRKAYRGRVADALLRENFLLTSGVMIRKEAFTRLGGFDESLEVSEDYDLWLRAAQECRFAFVDRPLLLYRVQGPSTFQGNLDGRLRARDTIFKKLAGGGGTRRPSTASVIRDVRRRYDFRMAKHYLESGDVRRARTLFRASIGASGLWVRTAFWLFASRFPAAAVRRVVAASRAYSERRRAFEILEDAAGGAGAGGAPVAGITDGEARAVSSALWLSVGRLVRIGFAFLLPVILTRFLTQHDYGAYKRIDLVASLLAPVLLLSFDRSVTNFVPRSQYDSQRESSTVFWATVMIFTLFLTPVVLFPILLQRTFSVEPELFMVLAIVFSTLEGGLHLIAQRALVAVERGKIAGLAPVFFGIPYFAALILAAVATRSLRACALVVAVNGLLVSVGYGIILWKVQLLRLRFNLEILRRHLRFATPLWLIGTAQTWGGRMDRFLVSVSMSTVEFGIYTVGNTGIPFVNVIPASIRDACAPVFAEFESERKYAEIARLWRRGTEIVLPSFLLISAGQIYLADVVIRLMYTDKFAAAAPVFMVSAAMTFLAIFSGLETILRALSAFRFLAFFAIGSLLLRIVGGTVALGYGNLPLQAGVQAAVTAIGVWGSLWYTRRRLEVRWRDLLPSKGWGVAVVLIGACLAACTLLDVYVREASLPVRTVTLLLPWAAAGSFLLSGLAAERRRVARQPTTSEGP